MAKKIVSAATGKLMSDQFYGTEPAPPKDREITESELAESLKWYNYCTDAVAARRYYKELLQSQNRTKDIQTLKSVPDTRLNLTGARMARVVMLGGILSERSKLVLEKRIKETLSYASNETKKDIVKAPQPSIQDRIREKNSDLCAELNGMIDDGLPSGWSCYKWLQQKNATPLQSAYIAKQLVDNALEITAALNSQDEELAEAYRGYDKKELRAMALQQTNIVIDCDRFAQTNKKIRAPQKKKPLSVEKVLKTFKYAKSNDKFRIASVDPVKVLGCQELYMFNSKTNVLTVLRALDRAGLNIKGTTITNYDEKTSYCKPIGRKTQETIDLVLSGGKVALRKIQDGSKPVVSARTNDATILLKELR